ncbi:hypothetical protein HDV00_000168 [Rhizophlyctis rosea]|nr:hypothetical protein HDV00_000168 [Rhizophlyctis rosea]
MASSPAKVNLIASQIVSWFRTLRPETRVAPTTHPSRPLIVGINGLQGSGKTTLTTALVKTLSSPPYLLTTATFSTDDLYLTHAEQTGLAASNPDNPLLQYRGNPGTHDIQLGVETFQRIISAHQTALTTSPNHTTTIPLPSYDKSLNNGRGDRLPEPSWPTTHVPLDILLFEGCYLGFKPLPQPALDSLLKTAQTHRSHPAPPHTLTPHHLTHYNPSHIHSLNNAIKPYVQSWHPYIDAFVHLTAQDPSWVYDWRWEQEEALKRKLNNPSAGLTRDQVDEFVDRFAPMYVLCLPQLTDRGFFWDEELGAVTAQFIGRHLQVLLNKDREVVSSHVI